MEIRTVLIREELIKCFRQLEAQIEEVDKEAHEMGIKSEQLRTPNGGWPMVPLITAKVQILHSFALLQEKHDTKGRT